MTQGLGFCLFFLSLYRSILSSLHCVSPDALLWLDGRRHTAGRTDFTSLLFVPSIPSPILPLIFLIFWVMSGHFFHVRLKSSPTHVHRIYQKCSCTTIVSAIFHSLNCYEFGVHVLMSLLLCFSQSECAAHWLSLYPGTATSLSVVMCVYRCRCVYIGVGVCVYIVHLHSILWNVLYHHFSFTGV